MPRWARKRGRHRFVGTAGMPRPEAANTNDRTNEKQNRDEAAADQYCQASRVRLENDLKGGTCRRRCGYAIDRV